MINKKRPNPWALYASLARYGRRSARSSFSIGQNILYISSRIFLGVSTLKWVDFQSQARELKGFLLGNAGTLPAPIKTGVGSAGCLNKEQ